MLIGDIPERNARFYPDEPAIIDGPEVFTFLQFRDRVHALANGLLGSGLAHGQRVAVLQENSHQYIELYFAAAVAGLAIVPLNYRMSKDELLYVLQDSEPRLLAYGSKYAGLADQLRQALPAVRPLRIDNEAETASQFEQMIAGAGTHRPRVQVDESDIIILGYTGGTTGRPKGVMSTHRNIVTSCYNTALERKLRAGMRFLNVPPLFHAADANSMFAFSFIGGTNVLIPDANPTTILAEVERRHITHTLLVPAMILRMTELATTGRYDLSSLQVIYYGTAPMPVEPLRRAMAAFGCGFSQTYGATETFVPITILQPEDHVPDGTPDQIRRLGSAGRPVMGVQVRILDAAGTELAPGQIGEILVKGANVMRGYWRSPDLTAQVLRDGWYATGDMGFMDELGYLYIADRSKDMIISGGENIYPSEVENVLFEHPAVAEVAVIGVPDERWGESVKALVVAKAGTAPTEQELIDFCKSRLASYKKPRSVTFEASLPRSAAGKLLKRELRERYWKEAGRMI